MSDTSPGDGLGVGNQAAVGPVVSQSTPSLRVFAEELVMGPYHPHGSNILKKGEDRDVLRDVLKSELIKEIAASYRIWRTSALRTSPVDLAEPEGFVEKQTQLFQSYRDLLDDERFDAFDSRGALQPSALEEFCYFLFRPLLADLHAELSIGHHEVFQGLYFTAGNFMDFASIPRPMYPVGNLDFVIGKRVTSTMETDSARHVQDLHVAAVAIECKTYLDRPRWIESDVLATNIKRGFPGCLYILVSEFLKLDLAKVNIYGSQIDKVYVLRKQNNVDRRIRREGGTALAPLHLPAMVDLFNVVRDHLNDDWARPEDWKQTGILK